MTRSRLILKICLYSLFLGAKVQTLKLAFPSPLPLYTITHFLLPRRHPSSLPRISVSAFVVHCVAVFYSSFDLVTPSPFLPSLDLVNNGDPVVTDLRLERLIITQQNPANSPHDV